MAARSTNGTQASAANPAVAAAEADAAEAEAAEAEALAAAAAARAKAARLRQQAEESRASIAQSKATERGRQEAAAAPATPGDGETSDEKVDAESVTVIDGDPVTEYSEAEEAVAPVQGWRRWVPGWQPVAVSVAVIALVALLVLSGLMIWSRHNTVQRGQRAAAFATGARQGVVYLMSLNFNNGQADLQRVLDSTTGSLHDDFQKSEKDFLTVMQDSKVVTSTAVTATAIESMTADSAVVLVTATSQVANNASQQPSPRSWRLSVSVDKENDQIKMSKVEFVP